MLPKRFSIISYLPTVQCFRVLLCLSIIHLQISSAGNKCYSAAVKVTKIFKYYLLMEIVSFSVFPEKIYRYLNILVTFSAGYPLLIPYRVPAMTGF